MGVDLSKLSDTLLGLSDDDFTKLVAERQKRLAEAESEARKKLTTELASDIIERVEKLHELGGLRPEVVEFFTDKRGRFMPVHKFKIYPRGPRGPRIPKSPKTVSK